MGPLTAYAFHDSYWRHLVPIVEELRARGHDVERVRTARDARGPVIVASHADARRYTNRVLIYVEHGAGQTYAEGPTAGYSGAAGLDNVRLFICPNEHVAERWRARYPQAAVETVGSPALDKHVRSRPRSTPRAQDDATGTSPARPSGRVVAITCHWACGVVPETMPALPHFESAIRNLETRYRIVGHAHPRIARRMAQKWEELGIQYEPDPDVVLRTADLLIADNTSLLYEAAALDVPCLVLNAPWYRKDVEHGLRFWSHVPGIQVDEPAELERAIERSLRDPQSAQRLRRRAAKHVYAAVDGRATQRAADAIEEALA